MEWLFCLILFCEGLNCFAFAYIFYLLEKNERNEKNKMRANVKVVGIGQRTMGTSAKTGRSYDFTPVSICYPDAKFTGYRAATVNMQTEDVQHHNVQLNTELDMVFHFYNGNIAVDAIL